MQRKTVILDADSLGNGDVSLEPIQSIKDIYCDLYAKTQSSEVLSRIKDAKIVFTNKVPLTEETLSKSPHIEYIGVLATGTNCIDMAYCQSRGITVQNVEGYGTSSVTQHTLMLLLNLVCKSGQQIQKVRQGDWSQSDQFCLMTPGIIELAGKTAVIVGYGELGKSFSEVLKALGMRIIIASAPGRERKDRPALDECLPKADVLSLHCLLSEQTSQMINAKRISMMKKNAYLINTSRGGLINETDLLDSLLNGNIGGAGLDVLTVEPPSPDNPLLQANLPNLLITPHWAWGATEARQRLIEIAADHLKNYLSSL